MGQGISFWKARQSNMTSVSSAVTMTAFDPVLAACSACKSKRVSASSCVDCSSATSTHSSVVILKQMSSQVTHNALPCSISLYICPFHSPTKNLLRLVLLNELLRHFIHFCMLCPLAKHVYRTVVLAHRLRLSESLMDGWRYTSKTTSTLPLCPPTYSTMPNTDSVSCANVLLLPFILCTRPIPSMIQVDGVGIASAGDTFFSSSWQWAQWVGKDILQFYTSALSHQDHLAKEVSVCLQNYILAFRSGCLCADSRECLLSLLRHLVVEFHGWWIVVLSGLFKRLIRFFSDFESS